MYSTWFFFAQIQRFHLKMSQEVQLIVMLLNLIAHNYLICIFVCVINPIFYLAQGVQLENRSEIGNGANGGRDSGVKKRGRLGSGHIEKAREVWVGSHWKSAGGLSRVTWKSAGGLSWVTLKKRGRLGSGHTEKAREAWVGSHREARVNFLYYLLSTLLVTTVPLTVLLENYVIPPPPNPPNPHFPLSSPPPPLGEK